MLRFNKKVEYALMALLEISDNKSGVPVTTKALARKYHIPLEVTGKVLQTLTKCGLLQSVQGIKGGYLLAQKPEQVSILRVVEAIEGPVSLIACSSGKLCDCGQIIHCNIKTPMEIIQQELIDFFDNITLIDLQERYRSLFSITALSKKKGSVSANSHNDNLARIVS